MSYIAKPVARHPKQRVNALGLTTRDYEGAMSTLCAGCGHDSVTAALIQAFFELDAPPARVCTAEVPLPYPRHLEEAALPSVDRVVTAVRSVLDESM